MIDQKSEQQLIREERNAFYLMVLSFGIAFLSGMGGLLLGCIYKSNIEQFIYNIIN